MPRALMTAVVASFSPLPLMSPPPRPRHEHTDTTRVNKKYRLSRKIGSGSFGDIYMGVNVTTGEEVRDGERHRGERGGI
jgi:hypothetical protein